MLTFVHCVFVNLEKAYDRLLREELWYCIRKPGVEFLWKGSSGAK